MSTVSLLKHGHSLIHLTEIAQSIHKTLGRTTQCIADQIIKEIECPIHPPTMNIVYQADRTFIYPGMQSTFGIMSMKQQHL